MPHQIQGPFLFLDKISGQNTHAPDPGKPGLVEMLKLDSQLNVFTVSRLDKGTSGALVFALDPVTAKELSELFEAHQVKKTYLFLSHQLHKQKSFEKESFIAKEGAIPTSDLKNPNPNAKTLFEYVKPVGKFHLYQATPLSGKPHQIRMHAEDSGVPVLGDPIHGGQNYYRICLHALSLEFVHKNINYKFTAKNPVWLADLSEQELRVFECLAKRQALIHDTSAENKTLRWIHNEIDDFRMDQFGSHLWIYWYKATPPDEQDFKIFELLKRTLGKEVWIRQMLNRGSKADQSLLWSVGQPEKTWICTESEIQYEMRAEQGLSPGLFLDQMQNRLWVQNHSVGKSVLNLFCYTGGFSLAASKGGAASTCSVDAGSQYIKWTQTNFLLNGIDPKNGKHEFWEADCLFFLKSCIKRGRKFDLIVCDPPSVGRSKEGTFQIHKNLPELLELCLKCLNPGGEILLSTNYEGWTLQDLQKQVFIHRNFFEVKVLPTPHPRRDFELPDEPPLMKSLIVSLGSAKKKT